MFIARSRSHLLVVAALVTVSLTTGGTTFAQAPADTPTIRDYCIKLNAGKFADYEAHLKDVTLPVARARAEAGEFAWFIVARGVLPAGASARCDYRIVYGYKGLPPGGVARRAHASGRGRFWYDIDGVGSDVVKDNYLALNHNTVKEGQFAEWQKLELTYWKPLVEAWLKTGGEGAWSISSLKWPTGSSAPYSSLSVDVFPDWNSLVRGVPVDRAGRRFARTSPPPRSSRNSPKPDRSTTRKSTRSSTWWGSGRQVSAPAVT